MFFVNLKTKHWRLLGLLVAVLVSLGLVPSVVEAKLGVLPATPGIDSKQASRFVYELSPGTSRADRVALVNLSDAAVSVVLYPVDAQTTPSGDFQLAAEGSQMKGVGRFIEIKGETEYELQPQARQEVPILVRVPGEAKSGDYLGGLVVKDVETGESASARVYVTVPGDLRTAIVAESLRVLKKEGRPVFLLGLKNTGSTRVESLGSTIVVKNVLGFGADSTQTLPLNKELLPGGSIQVEIPWKQGLPYIGRLTAAVTVNYGRGQSLPAGSVSFWHFEVMKVLGLVVVVGGSGVLLGLAIRLLISGVRSFRSKRRQRERQESQVVVGAPMVGGQVGLVKEMDGGADMLFEMRKIIREELELHRHIQGRRRDKLGAILEELVLDGQVRLKRGKRKKTARKGGQTKPKTKKKTKSS